MEEQIAATLDDRQISDLVNDEQAWPAKEANALLKPTLPFGTGQRTDEVGKVREVDALSSFDGFDAERRGKMTLAGSRWAEEMHGLVSIDEAKLRQSDDAIAIERRLESEVEASECLDRRELCPSATPF